MANDLSVQKTIYAERAETVVNYYQFMIFFISFLAGKITKFKNDSCHPFSVAHSISINICFYISYVNFYI